MSERGSATVEHAALSVLLALIAITGIAALASGPAEGGRELGFAVARKLRCAAQGPGPCWRDPLTEAYGRSLAGAVRALAPQPRALPGPQGGLLVPVDFRLCRTSVCAAPGERFGLTASKRRVSTFTSAATTSSGARITYWEYRPGLAWSAHVRELGSAEIAELASTPLLEAQVPRLISLETLPGANHFEFAALEEPPWRWEIE